MVSFSWALGRTAGTSRCYNFCLTYATQAFWADTVPIHQCHADSGFHHGCNNKTLTAHVCANAAVITKQWTHLGTTLNRSQLLLKQKSSHRFIYTGSCIHSGRQILPNNYQEEDIQIAWNGINRSTIVMGERWFDASFDIKKNISLTMHLW